MYGFSNAPQTQTLAHQRVHAQTGHAHTHTHTHTDKRRTCRSVFVWLAPYLAVAILSSYVTLSLVTAVTAPGDAGTGAGAGATSSILALSRSHAHARTHASANSDGADAAANAPRMLRSETGAGVAADAVQHVLSHEGGPDGAAAPAISRLSRAEAADTHTRTHTQSRTQTQTAEGDFSHTFTHGFLHTLLVRALTFPHPRHRNPARRAWVAGRLDWHDLIVPGPTPAPPREAVGATAKCAVNDDLSRDYARRVREDDKADLINLLQGYTALGAVDVPRPPRAAMMQDGLRRALFGGGCSALTRALAHVIMRARPKHAGSEEPDEVTLEEAIEQLAGAFDTLHFDDITDWFAPAHTHTVAAGARIMQEVRRGNAGGAGRALVSGDWGALSKFAACDVVADACMVHNSVRACLEDELCGWCTHSADSSSSPTGGICVNRFAPNWRERRAGTPARVCHGPLWVNAQSVPAVWSKEISAAVDTPRHAPKAYRLGVDGQQKNRKQPPAGTSSALLVSFPPENCSVIVTRRHAVTLSHTGDSKMAYHFFTQTAPRWLADARASGGLQHLRTHVWMLPGATPEFWNFAQLWSDSCPRVLPSRADAAPVICYATRSPPELYHEAAAQDAQSVDELWTGGAAPVPMAVDHATGALLDSDDAQHPPMVEPLWQSIQRGQRLGLHGLHAALSALAQALFSSIEDGRMHPTLSLADECALLLQQPFNRDLDSSADPDSASVLQIDFAALAGSLRAGAKRVAEKEKERLGAVAPFLLGLASHQPQRGPRAGATSHPPPRITLISRRNKRFLLNEDDIVSALVDAGMDVAVAILESMPLYEQMMLFQRTDVLIGMHGSGLINTQFMRPKTAVLQLVPYHVVDADKFFEQPAKDRDVRYSELSQITRNHSLVHAHFLDASYRNKIEQTLASRSDCCGPAVYFSFFINQDIQVDVAALVSRVKELVPVASLG